MMVFDRQESIERMMQTCKAKLHMKKKAKGVALLEGEEVRIRRHVFLVFGVERFVYPNVEYRQQGNMFLQRPNRRRARLHCHTVVILNNVHTSLIWVTRGFIPPAVQCREILVGRRSLIHNLFLPATVCLTFEDGSSMSQVMQQSCDWINH